jgi:hypothetical protein
MSPQKMPPDAPPEKRLRKSTSVVDSSARPEKSYLNRRIEYTLRKTKEHSKVELAAALVAGLIAGIAGKWVGVGFAIIGFIGAILTIILFHFFEAPRGLDKERQLEIDGLNATIKDLQVAIDALEVDLDTEVNNHTKDIQSLNNKNYGMWETLRGVQAEKEAVGEERDSLKAQIEELTKYTLYLVVDTDLHFGEPHDVWDVFQSNAGLFLDAGVPVPYDLSIADSMGLFSVDLRIFFENRGTNKVIIRTVRASLLRKTGKGREKRIRTGKVLPIEVRPITSSPLTLDGWWVEGLMMTQPMYFRWKCELADRIGRRLNRNCFLRISMDAMNQPLFNVDLDVDWETSRTKKRTVPVILRS